MASQDADAMTGSAAGGTGLRYSTPPGSGCADREGSEEPCEAGVAPRVTILVCSTCRPEDGSDVRPTPGEKLAEATRAANTHKDIAVETIECLANCKRRLSASLVTPGAWTYVFGDLTIDNAADLIDGALLMRDSVDGLMPWRGRPQCMKKGMVARIPPLASDKRHKGD